jgi:hypothetical protein
MPHFVLEVISPNDTVTEQRTRAANWVSCGAEVSILDIFSDNAG